MRRAPVLALVLALDVVWHVPAQAETVTSKELLARLPVAAEAGSSSYDRRLFPHWADADGDGCDTREEVLIAESETTVRPGSGCSVTTGSWLSWYDDERWTQGSDVDIDHVVALKEAWESGARSWTASERKAYANDLGFSWSLDAVTDNVNQSKGDRDPAAWLPPLHRCKYARHWMAVKYRWRLSVDSTEKAALTKLLSGDCGSMSIALPRRAR